MEYLGTLDLPKSFYEDPKTGRRRTEQIEAGFRRESRILLYKASAHGLLNMGLHIPSLTGSTRAGVKAAIVDVQSKIREMGGSLNIADDLWTKLSSSSVDADNPPVPIGDKQYKYQYHTATGVPYHSRREWRNAEAFMEISPNLDFTARGNQYSGVYAFGFHIDSPHWDAMNSEAFNLGAKPGGNLGPSGEFNVESYFDRTAHDYLESHAPRLAEKYASEFAGQSATDNSMDPEFDIDDDEVPSNGIHI